ncbi:AAA family ATPase [Streptomyces sp. NPDC050121]|uniref:AAA family ATPase n=1 Tax=Streptomyces sp. NPDC050121 TaxID=3365601 RepID=UPI003795DBA0
MKPLRLTLTGVRSRPGACTIDATDRNLPAIAGATGAGKSTILESIIFALYGPCSWSTDNKGAQEPSRIALEDITTEAS